MVREKIMIDYKKIITKRETRVKILRALSFIPDEIMLKIQYFIKFGRRLNLKSPQRFTEKMQFYKLYYRNELMPSCVDKCEVRKYLREQGVGQILNECYGVFDDPQEINYDLLPDKFVLKDTLGGGGNSIIICKDKAKADLDAFNHIMSEWVHIPLTPGPGREWPYYCGKRHRIIIEKYIEPSDSRMGLRDYKFFCFDGKVEFLYVMGDRNLGDTVKLSIYDKDFNKLPVVRCGDEELTGCGKPANYEELLTIAERLSKPFPHVRVDLYDEEDRIIFGELTFFNASGYMKYDPDKFDFEIGRKFNIDFPVANAKANKNR